MYQGFFWKENFGNLKNNTLSKCHYYLARNLILYPGITKEILMALLVTTLECLNNLYAIMYLKH